jgi:uncharacterized membrane protein (TIGR02234 family)
MSGGTTSGARRLSPRWEYGLALLAGAAGAGLIFLGVRQGWARVHTSAPRPLPGSTVTVTGQDLIPAASALAIAGLATLAAVIATRGLARRLAGVLLALLGAGAAAVVLLPLSDATVIRAAASASGLTGAAGSTTGAGSVTGGGTSGTGGTAPIAGFLAHVSMTGGGWRALAVTGGVIMVAAGLLTALRSARWPVMSSRYELPHRAARPAPETGPQASAADLTQTPAQSPGQPGHDQDAGPHSRLVGSAPRQTSRQAQPAEAGSAALWESLSRGEDPTDTPDT